MLKKERKKKEQSIKLERESEEAHTVKLSDSVMDDANEALIVKCERDELLREALTLGFVGRRENDREE